MVKPPKSIPHKDHYQRISFLYQSSSLFANSEKYQVLSRALARNVDLVSKKTVLKLTPAMKRTICKKCHTNLIPGINMKIRIENLSKKQSEKSQVLVHQCNNCLESKRFPIGKNKDYKLFSEREDIAIDVD
ncbi:ribonuclease P protein subunit Rpr2p [[Candida] railenensis]|uniref:Ribonuclease P protein subunit Rpr2p n=1 Tax=[Candida] railenensis TaxID=45579 RepID=A0A9P0QKJ4_9ASCO|nr:ribonuclease P protein subunit Rpr2p [[Candida] railenensis]